MRNMTDTSEYQQFYRDMYAYIGYSLAAEHAMPRDEIRVHEERLRIKVPPAVVAYYEVAGNETKFNYCHDQLMLPKDWYIVSDHLVFYEAHQAVVVYGVRLDSLDQPNPQVETTSCPEDPNWFLISPSVTEFFQITTYWQGVFAGAMTDIEHADVDESIREKLDADWEYVGELNKMWCYRRPRQVACLLKWDEWTLHAGGATAEECDKIARDLGVTWKPWL